MNDRNLVFVGRLLLWIKLSWEDFRAETFCIISFIDFRHSHSSPMTRSTPHCCSVFFSFFSLFLSKQHGETLQGFWFLLLLCHCHIILTDTEKPRQPAAFKISSFFKVWFLVLRQEHSSGVEGSQPVRGNLCCMGKTPQGSLHICSVVAQGQDRAK